MTRGIGNVPRLLEHADGTRRSAADRPEDAASTAPDENLSSFIRLSLDDARAAHLLQHAAAHLSAGWPTDVTAATILDETMALTGAELGNVQLAEPGSPGLRIVASAGFGPEFLDHFAVVVDDDTSACGRAAAGHRQTVITDVDADEDFAPHREVAAASKFRAVQSTPLVDAAGNLVGVVSTHFPRPGAPPARALEVTRLYGLLAGEALARSLNGRSTPQLDGHGAQQPWSDPSSALPRTAVLDLTDTIVRALLSAGLSLAGAQSLIGDAPAGDRVAEAIDELDQALDGIRSAVLDLHG